MTDSCPSLYRDDEIGPVARVARSAIPYPHTWPKPVSQVSKHETPAIYQSRDYILGGDAQTSQEDGRSPLSFTRLFRLVALERGQSYTIHIVITTTYCDLQPIGWYHSHITTFIRYITSVRESNHGQLIRTSWHKGQGRRTERPDKGDRQYERGFEEVHKGRGGQGQFLDCSCFMYVVQGDVS
jgi:hypothetical protein